MQPPSVSYSYTNQDILRLRRTYPEPEGLLRIVLNGNSSQRSGRKTHPKRIGGRSDDRGGRGGGGRRHPDSRRPHHPNRGGGGKNRGGGNSGWARSGGGGGGLEQSENSFSVARRRKKDQSQSEKIISQIRGTLNKVTEDNFDAVESEVNDTELFSYANELEQEDQEEFLTEIAKLIVRKSQIDHDFNGLYAALASKIAEKIEDFGDIIYEVCRESIPTTRYDPYDKKDYLGALFLLVELRKRDLVSPGGISTCVDRLMSAIDRCDPNAVLSVVGGADNNEGINPMEQTELCVELVCKILPPYLAIEHPTWVERTIQRLKDLSVRKDRIKPRSRFMLGDFFKEIEKLTHKQ